MIAGTHVYTCTGKCRHGATATQVGQPLIYLCTCAPIYPESL
jgi:hypothetical protein